MENIIKKAIEGGYEDWYLCNAGVISKKHCEMTCDPLFWQALGKATWAKNPASQFDAVLLEWKSNALRFHEINLTEGWGKAVAYLKELIKE